MSPLAAHSLGRCHDRAANNFGHVRRVAIAKRLYPLASGPAGGLAHLAGRPSIHSYSSELIRVPITSGICCPLDAFNRGWERLPGERQSRQAGAGNQEHSPANIRRTNVTSAEFKSGDMAASVGKIATDFGFPCRVSGRLLHDKPFCAHVDPNAEHVGPEAFAVPVSVNSGSDTCPLAGRPADDDIRRDSEERVNVVMNWGLQEAFDEPCAAPGIALTERDRFNTRPAKADSVAADAREQIKRSHRRLLRSS